MNYGCSGITKVSIVPVSRAVAGTVVGAAAGSGKCDGGLHHIRLAQCSHSLCGTQVLIHCRQVEPAPATPAAPVPTASAVLLARQR